MKKKIHRFMNSCFCGILLFSCIQSIYALDVSRLRVEALENPVGIDVEKPSFSWILQAEGRGIKQTAYAIKVFSDQGKEQEMWSSGKIASDQSTFVKYKGSTLMPSTRYYWEVSVWDNQGNQAVSTEPAYFETGLMGGGWNNAQWIKAASKSTEGIPVFRKEFTANSNIKSAKLYSSALGVYDVFINGKRVGTLMPDGTTRFEELKPGSTDYAKEINYYTHDVTSLVVSGDNAIAAQVGTGWWAGAIANGIYGSSTVGFIAKLKIEYEDGSSQIIVTDTSWKSSNDGPVLLGDIFHGETYNALKENGWTSSGFDDSTWDGTAVNTDFKGIITAYKAPPVLIRDELRRDPQSVTVYDGVKNTGTDYGTINVVSTHAGTKNIQLQKGKIAVFDMGQNMVGWVKITVKGKAGTKLRFRFGEMLNDTGSKSRADDGPGGSVYTYNLRTAKATLRYVLKGSEEGETYQPSMTFFGFRYCDLLASDDIEILALTGEVVGSAIEEGSIFETSHQDVNQLYSNVKWSQRGNFLSIPTDCPQRDERMGWTGDTQIFSRAAAYNGDVKAFFHKWMGDMRNSQTANGAYPDIAPYSWRVFGAGGNAAWADAGIIVPWNVYQMYGDKSILEENYVSMTRYMQFLATQVFDGYTYNGPGATFGDWLAFEETNSRYVSVCYYAYVTQLMEKICRALSTSTNDTYDTTAKSYATLYQNIKAEFQTRYVRSSGQLTEQSQTAYLLALKMDLFPDETAKNNAITFLRNKIITNGNKLSTGFVGTGILNQMLSELKQDDIAYNLLLQRDNPSWLYSIDQGATTIWERWDSYTKEGGFNKHPWIMNSFNHYSYGAVSEWMFRYVSGIEVDENAPGFKHFFLKPTPDQRTTFPKNQERITWVKATYPSYFGDIVSHWEANPDGGISYRATVPVNTTATLYLPIINENDLIYESGILAEESEGVEFIGLEDGKAIFQLQSGSYHFYITEITTVNYL